MAANVEKCFYEDNFMYKYVYRIETDVKDVSFKGSFGCK